MKSQIIITTGILLLSALTVNAAQQILNSTDNVGVQRGKINSNFTDNYTNKADKSTAVMLWSAYGVGASFTVESPVVVYNGVIYKCISPYTKVSGETPDTQPDYFTEVTGAGGSGDIEGVSAGTGLSGGGTSGSVVLSADTAYLQRRVSSKCSAGSSIREVAVDGTVICETDDTGSGSVPSGTVSGQVLTWATDQWVVGIAPWLTTALLSTENTWTAVQDFNAGLTATGITMDLTSWTDWTFGGVQIVNASGTGDNVLWPASKVINELAGKQAGLSVVSPLILNPTTNALSISGDAYQPYQAAMIAWPATVSTSEVESLDSITGNIETRLDTMEALLAGGGTGIDFIASSYPADQSCAFNTTDQKIYCRNGASVFASAAMTLSATVDEVAPTLSSVTIGTTGQAWTFDYSENVTASTTADLCDGYTVSTSIAGEISLSYASGSGTDTIVCAGNKIVKQAETITAGLNYTPGSIADGYTNYLASITGGAVTNSSTYMDPVTFGNTELYTSGIYSLNNTSVTAYKLPATTSSGTLASLSAGVLGDTGTGSKRFKISLYAHDAVNDRPAGTPLATTSELTTPSTNDVLELKTGAATASITNATVYWIVIQCLDDYAALAKSAYGATGKQRMLTRALTPYDWTEWTVTGTANANYAYTVYMTVQ